MIIIIIIIIILKESLYLNPYSISLLIFLSVYLSPFNIHTHFNCNLDSVISKLPVLIIYINWKVNYINTFILETRHH